jgi:serine/threonine-protein kinase
MARTALLSGRALNGRYELDELIGEGTFGRVYRGRDLRLERLVAIKVIKPWWTEDPDWARSFEREAQLMARVSHPGIVQIYDIGYAGEGLYYVAELVDGQSLADRLREGSLSAGEARGIPAGEARGIAEQLCRALAQAHAKRVVHRDVKPANVLIAPDGRVKIGDFGIARLAEGTTDGASGMGGAGGTIVGTPRYMAPEQARGRPTSPATDVYGVGVVLYEMLAGRPPFTERAAVELALRHVSDPPPPLPARTPSALVEIVERALAKDPADRYPSAREMADALADAGATERRAAPEGVAPPLAAEPSDGARVAARGDGPPRTRVKRLSPRRNVNPPESRRYRALLAGVVLILAGLITGAILFASGAVRVPDLRGAGRATVARRLQALGLHARFATTYSQAPTGRAITQSPAPGVHVGDGSTIAVTLSAGPPPVSVPSLVGQTQSSAETTLSQDGLKPTATTIAAPGTAPGIVVRQSPDPGTSLPRRSTVALSVAEYPRWRPLTSFTGGHSVPFQIRGNRWQMVSNMSYDGTCLLIFFCSGPSVELINPSTGATIDQFDLAEGNGKTHVFNTGPGLYQINVTPGSDSASWSVGVDDYY